MWAVFHLHLKVDNENDCNILHLSILSKKNCVFDIEASFTIVKKFTPYWSYFDINA